MFDTYNIRICGAREVEEQPDVSTGSLLFKMSTQVFLKMVAKKSFYIIELVGDIVALLFTMIESRQGDLWA